VRTKTVGFVRASQILQLLFAAYLGVSYMV